MKKQIQVVGAVLIRNGLVLAAQRGGTGALAGAWEFPGGKIEPEETPEYALRRELQEELLVDAVIGEHVETTTHEYEFGVVTLSTYYATLQGGEPVLTEHAEVRWLAPSDLLSVSWAPADVPAVERIMRELSGPHR